MVDALVASDFAELVDALPLGVRAAGPDGPVEIALAVTAVTTGTAPSSEYREPFSVALRGPRDPVLEQGTYEVHHPRLGPLELFVVPNGSGPDGGMYSITVG